VVAAIAAVLGIRGFGAFIGDHHGEFFSIVATAAHISDFSAGTTSFVIVQMRSYRGIVLGGFGGACVGGGRWNGRQGGVRIVAGR
jgi:hypothetical protein